MKLIFSLLFSAIIAVSLQAQPYFNFLNYEEVPCPYDSTIIIKKVVDWEVYQTENDLWDGVHLAKCIPIEGSNFGVAKIPLAYINLDKPVFLGYSGDRDRVDFQLKPNYLYNANAYINQTRNFTLKSGFDCPGEWCSGLMINVQVPDETGDSNNIRTYRHDNMYPQPNDFQICYATEYFADIRMNDLVMKFTVLPEGDVNDDFIFISGFEHFPSFSAPYLISELPIPEFFRNDSVYEVKGFFEFIVDWGQHVLAIYDDTDTYPSADNIFYIETYPEFNVPEPQKIQLYLDPWNQFYMQPFTALRGGLVEDSDSIRHSVEIINENFDFCLDQIIELTIDGENSRYTHASGDIYFGNKNSCMQFRNGAALNIAEDAEFKFGDEGNGILVFRGGKLELQKNATFILDARMDFSEGTGAKKGKNQNISVNLERGKKLIFTKKAQLLNRASQKDLKLDIYMNGGELDMENLDADSRRLINLIYPEPKPAFAENIEVFPNPVSDYLNIRFLGKADEKLTIELLDLTGRVFYKKEETAAQGWNEFSISDLNFARGVYFLKMSSGGNQVTERIFVK